MPNCVVTRAAELAGLVRRRCTSRRLFLQTVSFQGESVHSVGVAWSSGIGKSRETSLNDEDWGQALFRAADSALYAAKEAGRTACAWTTSRQQVPRPANTRRKSLSLVVFWKTPPR
jgi:GGDEF domain-containing protein